MYNNDNNRVPKNIYKSEHLDSFGGAGGSKAATIASSNTSFSLFCNNGKIKDTANLFNLSNH